MSHFATAVRLVRGLAVTFVAFVAGVAFLVPDASAYARMCTTADTLLFGNRAVGTATTLTSTVRNCGDEAWSFTGTFPHPQNAPDYQVATTCVTGRTLAPAEACTVDVTFAPRSAGQVSGAQWLHNTSVTPDQLITFYGRGVDARSGTAAIAFEPGVMDFGAQPVGRATAPQALLLRNTGTAAFTPSALVLNGPAAYDFATLGSGDAADCALGRAVAPGATCRMNLVFQPTAAGSRNANLVVDAPELPALAVLGLTGRGATATLDALVDVIEYHHAPTRQYFLTPDAAEAAFLDGGGLGPDWVRTGFAFRAYGRGDEGVASTLPVCRFFGAPNVGPNSHFYTADPAECALVRADPHWQDEGIAFRAVLPAAGACPAGTAAVQRLWQPGSDPTGSRHRYLMDVAEAGRMVAAGWVLEGPVFCAPAPAP